MRRMSKLAAAAIAALLLALVGPAPPGAAQGTCESPQVARQLLTEGRVVTLPDAMQRAGVSGKVLNADLCRSSDATWDYRVQLRQQGAINTLNIPAN